MNRADHQHACIRCGASFACDGEPRQNHDGFPSTICLRFHLRNDKLCSPCDAYIYGDAETGPEPLRLSSRP